ncbi:hypothetical protein BH23BAC3_BH23BAC3_30940 [soil metagenome]
MFGDKLTSEEKDELWVEFHYYYLFNFVINQF